MFQKARLKLTAWYLLILMTISISFSAVIFKVSSNEVERFANLQRSRIERRLENPIYNTFPNFPRIVTIDPKLIEDTEGRLLLNLIILNIAIAVVAGSGSYFLASLTLKPIKDMLEEQNRFISDASHELGTPLTSLKTAMEVFLRGKNSTLSEAKVLATESITEVNKLQSLSESLLELAQYQKPKNTPKLETFNLKEVVEKSLKKVAPIAKAKEISIKTDLTNIKLLADKEAISEIVVILLDNAIKYSVKKSKVLIKTKKIDGFVRIEVEDHGIGIAKDDLPHIFDRFYRGDIARSKVNSDGFGLGLSIAKKIIDLHNGKISVASVINKGSTFTVDLPTGI